MSKETISIAQKRKEEYLSNAKAQMTLGNFIIYSMMVIGLFGLGLLNWTDWTFDIRLITVAYLLSFGVEVFSYASIIVSMSTHQLEKRKKASENLYDIERFNNKVIENYRPEELGDYVYEDNMAEKRKMFLEKYKMLLNKLHRKYNKEETQRSWKQYQKDIKEAQEKEEDLPEPPNRYCRLKEEYLYKINNVDKLYQEEHVPYDELHVDDLVIGIGKSNGKRVPRATEGSSLSLGVARGALVMAIGGILTTVLIVQFRTDGIDAIVKTFITVFFVFLSMFKGLMNGERVYEQVTLRKALFRKKHLHAYCMYEVNKHKFVVVDDYDEH